MAEVAEGPDLALIKLGAGRGLTKKTMQTLYDAGFRNKKEVMDIAERQMRDLEIPAAQKFRLRKLVEDLLVARNDEPEEEADTEQQDAEEVVTETTTDGATADPETETNGQTEGGEEKEKIALMPKSTLLNKMLRPHEEVFGDKTKDGSFLQFIYANLLTLENMYRTDKAESIGYLHHLHFLTLKMMQQYPVQKVFQYDHIVRSKIDAHEMNWHDRSNISLDDELVVDLFEEEHLLRWKKMRRQNSIVDAFKMDRCLKWNYNKDGEDVCPSDCKFLHICLACGAEHSVLKCPSNSEKKKRKAEAAAAVSPRPGGIPSRK